MTTSLDHALDRYAAGDRAGARQLAAAVGTASPEYADALNLQAVIAQEEGRQTEAEALARDALVRGPDNGIYFNTLGNSLLSQGRSDEALAAFRQAHRLLPLEADILFNMANAARDIGDAQAAARDYRRAVSLRHSRHAAAGNPTCSSS